jgi:aflatoxin B1 aldehyde reductase
MCRHVEDDVFPLLRKLNIAFSVYSPLAGGFLVKTPEAFQANESALAGGRFDKTQGAGQVYHKLYNKQPLVESLAEWNAIARKAGVTNAALAFRWLGYHSALRESLGDTIVLGASRASQLREGLESLRAGPLDDEIVDQIQGFWEKVKEHSPVDNFHG